MRLISLPIGLVMANLGLVACSNGGVSPVPGTSGGALSVDTSTGLSSGGSQPTTGGLSSSNTVNTGSVSSGGSGTRATGGGTAPTGGRSGVGGATGGTRATGGSSSTLRGGSTATGGTSAGGISSTTGGTSVLSNTGGSKATGGAATGGTKATGGAPTGGTKATGGAATGGTSAGPTVNPLTNGKNGVTTRYWDCCKPSCAWKANAQAAGKNSPATSCSKDGNSVVGADTKNACESGGSAYQCNWGSPWQVSDTLSYGYAAFNGTNCGKCYQLDFTGSGDNPGAQSLKGKHMIVQAINIGSIGSDHFDLLIPGGGVGVNNACSKNTAMWSSTDLGPDGGGFLAKCGNNMSCVTDMCKAAFGSNTALMAGCSWFTGWFAGANNPGVMYGEVPCPTELTNKSGLK